MFGASTTGLLHALREKPPAAAALPCRPYCIDMQFRHIPGTACRRTSLSRFSRQPSPHPATFLGMLRRLAPTCSVPRPRGRVFNDVRRISSSRQPGCTDGKDLPNQLLSAALPFVPTHGFSVASFLVGAARHPELGQLPISHQTLCGLFPSTTIKSTVIPYRESSTEPIGPAKALAESWIAHGNHQMKSLVTNENLTLEKDGLEAVQRAFEIRLAYNRTIPPSSLREALALVVTPSDPFLGVPLPVELPHLIPYGSHALTVATDALAALKDYSKSREWMLRRIRLAGVYSAIELISVGHDEPDLPIDCELRRLIHASESFSAIIGDSFEYLTYIARSQRAIIKSLGLL